MKRKNPSQRVAWDSSSLYKPPRAPLRRAGTTAIHPENTLTRVQKPLSSVIPDLPSIHSFVQSLPGNRLPGISFRSLTRSHLTAIQISSVGARCLH